MTLVDVLPTTKYLLGCHQQLYSLIVLGVCDEEVRAACQEGWVGVFVQVLSDQLESSKLLGGKGQF